VSRLFPEPAATLAVKDVYTDVPFPEQRERPYVLINMVSSLDGKAVLEGKAGSIGSPTDRAIMRNLRARADAVMIGAGTLRAEKLTLAVPEDLARVREADGLNTQPLAIVVTETGNVPLQTNLLGSLPDNLLVLASPETPQARLAALSSHASVEVVPNCAAPEGDARRGLRIYLNGALETLKERYGVDVLLVEGGPALNHALVREGLVDELFLTLAPRLLGGERPDAFTVLEGPAFAPQESPKPELISVHLSGNELFFRYALRQPRPPSRSGS
jgi:riboflavin-specific deaminase-like protein